LIKDMKSVGGGACAGASVGSALVRVLVIGSGGREHALCLALAADPGVTALLCAPGNAGTAAVAEQRGVDPVDPAAVTALAQDFAADLVVIGPEAPLVAGVADAVRAAGIACFGPSGAAAQLEGSKAFAKSVMAAANVPTAAARLCTDETQAAAALDEFGPPYVVKDDGLAAGKGVVVTTDRDAALAHARDCGRVVIEEYLNGPEVSLFCVTDGRTVLPLLPAQDFKRVGDGDSGPNTGGMGAYAPLPWLAPELTDELVRTVALPTVAEMAQRGTPFAGLLYVGLAITDRGPRVVEFNARFGDPETQSVLALLETPLGTLLHAAATGTLAGVGGLRWRDGYAVTVVLAAEGYPGTPRLGDVITGSDQPGVIHAGTRRRDDGAIVSGGGRVLAATAVAATLSAAREQAYRTLSGVHLDGGQYRSDIAAKAVGDTPGDLGEWGS
jgi:phosphoribosylamine--glycine ligase